MRINQGPNQSKQKNLMNERDPDSFYKIHLCSTEALTDKKIGPVFQEVDSEFL